ncbi:hypothetical protein XBKQ1_2780021 [Xenorhabdus bovienii str. kraussei Quebec]|uniref:Uncharacterized protein n=3 Tax=Xenorhabdus bovienii TaxID=40576 RepID=A0A077PJ77_XENBV|nr:hypothetical protein XBKQ1_2780021 [Xenorhabdus bovienii str. kraussei Quebec]CDH22573.1 hypothetical protein XBKB1_1240010 [Xenorhabdus bovienii str. kraussei Becker Underwood]CDH33963.1 hypothetical protein XBI1_2810042 [Xenorhabdus bovienii str. Intermedium]
MGINKCKRRNIKSHIVYTDTSTHAALQYMPTDISTKFFLNSLTLMNHFAKQFQEK